MKKIVWLMFMTLILLAVTSQSAFALVAAGRLQVGRYKLQYSNEVPLIDELEILPDQKFRFWDNGTLKASFFFEGHFSAIQKLPDGSYQAQLEVERDGRLLDGKVVPRSTSEFNLRLRRMTIRVLESSGSTEVIMERFHSYRGNRFWDQERMADVVSTTTSTQFDFMGTPIDY